MQEIRKDDIILLSDEEKNFTIRNFNYCLQEYSKSIVEKNIPKIKEMEYRIQNNKCKIYSVVLDDKIILNMEVKK